MRIFLFVLIIFHTSDQYSQSYILHREVFMYAPVCHNNNLPYSSNILAFSVVGWKNRVSLLTLCYVQSAASSKPHLIQNRSPCNLYRTHNKIY